MEAYLEEIVSDLARVGAEVDVRLLLVGAHARDLCLPDSEGGRKTSDVDFAVELTDWRQVDGFFDACLKDFPKQRRSERYMYHRSTGIKVDIGPCGGIEAPPGTLLLPGTNRRLTLTGLSECFAVGQPLEPTARVLRLPPAGFVVLKLFAFIDRRHRDDLRDLGYVLCRFPYDEAEIWSDDELMAAFDVGVLTMDDVPFWRAGREIGRMFSTQTLSAVSDGFDKLMEESPELRSLIVESIVPALAPDERLTRADHVLRVVRPLLRA